MKTLQSILSRILEIEEAQVTDQLTPADVGTWDSMNALIMVSELESAFNVKFTSAEVTEVKCVGDIKKILSKHGAEIPES